MTTVKIESKNVLAHAAIVIAAVHLMTAAVGSVLAQTTTNSTASKNATTSTTSPNQRYLANPSPLLNITGSISPQYNRINTSWTYNKWCYLFKS